MPKSTKPSPKKTPARNRTGALASPELAKDMVAGTREFPPSSTGGPEELTRVRAEYMDGDPIGSIPSPAGAKKQDRKHALLADKLGERLAFERTGTRLYDGILGKLEAYGSFKGGPDREDVAELRRDELRHFHLLKQAIERMGGDPTAVTPSADVASTASQGVGMVIADPRTTPLQCLEAILIAELTDHDGWEALAELARRCGEEELAKMCDEALAEETEHLVKVRAWVAAGQGRPLPEA